MPPYITVQLVIGIQDISHTVYGIIAKCICVCVTTAAKFVLYIVCRRIHTPSMQALALDHRNDIISNTVAVACGIIGIELLD